VAEAGTTGQHVNNSGKTITDGALAQRRRCCHCSVRTDMEARSSQGRTTRHRSVLSGLRLCGVDAVVFGHHTPQNKKQMRKARSRWAAAFPKVGVAVMVELGLHNRWRQHWGQANRDVLASRCCRPNEQSLLINDAIRVPNCWSGCRRNGAAFPGAGQKEISRGLLEVYPEAALGGNSLKQGNALVRRFWAGCSAAGADRDYGTVVDQSAGLAPLPGRSAGLYARRWEQRSLQELKVDMRSTPCLQSHTPLTAMQEMPR